MKFQYVAQKHDHGCVVACIAMVLGKDYDEIDRTFENRFDRGGVKGDITRNYIIDYGFSVIEKVSYGYSDVELNNERMRVPFADIHVVSVQPFADSKSNHSLVMDSKGEIFDPARGEDHKEWDYYYVHRVMGFFDERKKRSAPKRKKR